MCCVTQKELRISNRDMWPKVARLVAAWLLCCAFATLAQTPENPTQVQPAPRPQYFAGTVVELDKEHIAVSRTLVGKSPEKRTFIVNAKTKIGKSVKLKSRVTVRYEHLPEGDTALDVRLRPSTRQKKS